MTHHERACLASSLVALAGVDPAIHDFLSLTASAAKAWLLEASPGKAYGDITAAANEC